MIEICSYGSVDGTGQPNPAIEAPACSPTGGKGSADSQAADATPAADALTATTTPLSPATDKRDLTGVPFDVLGLIYASLPPGHRLDLRGVSRSWAGWVDETLVSATHLNLVMDTMELQRALKLRNLRRSCTTTTTSPSADKGASGAAAAAATHGLLALQFPGVHAARLWIGCRPVAALSGLNGGGSSSSNCLPKGARSCSSSALSCHAAASQRVLLDTTSCALVAAYASLQNCTRALQGRLVEWWYGRRHQQRHVPRPLPTTPGPRWHVHKQNHPTGEVQNLRRYAQRAPEPLLEPLSACLPLLGSSAWLTRLSIVTAYNLSAEDLERLTTAFPNLAALALHCRQETFLDFTPVTLASLEPLFPAGELPGEIAHGPGCVDRPQRASTPIPPERDGGDGRCGSSGAGGVGLGPVAGPCPVTMPHLYTLVLCGLRCDWPPERGLQHLTQLRALVLHRTTCRMHRVLPQIKALTQLTRLELRRLDYHHALPMDQQDMRLLDCKTRWERDQRMQRIGGRPQEPRPPFPARRMVPTNLDTDWELGLQGSDDYYEAVAEEEVGLYMTPWLWVSEVQPAVRPDWPCTMRALGRAVRAMRELRVLVCDVQPPTKKQENAWPLLLAGVTELRNLQELRLPSLVFTHQAQPAKLAAALPELRCLEVCALPPPPAGDLETRPEAMRHPAFAGPRAMRRHYLPPPPLSYVFEGSVTCSGGDVYVGGGSNRKEENDEEEEAQPLWVCPCRRVGGAGNAFTEKQIRAVCEANAAKCVCVGVSGGGLGSFRRLRELVLHRASVKDLATNWLPLPPLLQLLKAPLQNGLADGKDTDQVMQYHDLLVLHSVLLPALARVPSLDLVLGGATCYGPLASTHAADVEGRNGGLLAVSMFATWLPGSLTSLDVSEATQPKNTTAELAAECLRLIATGMPQLRRLCCYLWTGHPNLMHPEGASSSHTTTTTAAAAPLRPGGAAAGTAAAAAKARRGVPSCNGTSSSAHTISSASGGGSSAPPSYVVTGVAPGACAVECINAMPRLEEFRVKVLSFSQPAVVPGTDPRVCHYRKSRVPLGLLRALKRPLQVVDGSPLDVWCSPNGATHPRDALQEARAALVASGCRSTLVSEEEEWAAGAVGLGPEMEATWRHGTHGV